MKLHVFGHSKLLCLEQRLTKISKSREQKLIDSMAKEESDDYAK
jgi:hypothetical protein